MQSHIVCLFVCPHLWQKCFCRLEIGQWLCLLAVNHVKTRLFSKLYKEFLKTKPCLEEQSTYV